jgi:hypothetical protein
MKAKATVASPPASIQATWANSDPTVQPSPSGAQGPTPGRVEISADALDRIVDELFAVGLALRAGDRSNSDQPERNTEAVPERLDRIIARIRQSVLSSTRPGRAQISVGITVDTTGQSQPPDLVALSSLPNGDLSSIDLLDAAHSATRALIALNDNAGPERRPPDAAATQPGG